MRLCAFADESDKTLEGQIAALHRNGIDLIKGIHHLAKFSAISFKHMTDI